MATVYYVEDDWDIAESVKTYLEIRQMEVFVFYSIADAKQELMKKRPAILLVDRNMPDGNGDELCRWIRRLWGNQLPILYLTVRGETADIVQGFQDGADDYVVKPFELEVLYSRILALLRRSGQTKETQLFCDHLLLDTEKMCVFYEQEEILLSQPEYQLLLLLMENKGKTVTRKQLLEQVWDSNGNYVNDNTLTVTMKRLREKLHNPTCLKTIRSFGYRMEESI
jgi:DNA-binding response regulator regX3